MARKKRTAPQKISLDITLFKPDKAIPIDENLSLVVLDLEKYNGTTPQEKMRHVTRWLIDQKLPFTDPDVIVPCIVLLGSYAPDYQEIIDFVDAGVSSAKNQKDLIR